MKRINCLITTLVLVFLGSVAWSQNRVTGAIGVYGTVYANVTTIASGGSINVGNNGNWVFGGNVISEDKGNGNSPTATGRSEKITFDGTGTYSSAGTTAGSTGFHIDGYAAAVNKSAGFILPIGNAGTTYPVTVPGSSLTTAAYFDGSGASNTNVTLAAYPSDAATVYSPYIDMPNGIPAGSYAYSYPAGFNTTNTALLVHSSNSSAAGTGAGTAYTSLALLGSNYSSTTATTTATTLPATGVTQVYFATKASKPLPITYLRELAAVWYNEKALLTWETANEINNTGFEVQRSTDGKKFNTIGFVKSLAKDGKSAAAISYTFTDETFETGTNFYRLNQIELDGNGKLSNVVSLKATHDVTIQLYPNPVTSFLSVQHAADGNQYKVIDLSGRVVLSGLISNPAQIDVQMLSSGTYILELSSNGAVISNNRFVKNR